MGGTSELVRLAAGDHGGGAGRRRSAAASPGCRWRGIDLMRPLSDVDARARNVLGVACFPMLPYANRIEGNAFVFDGQVLAVRGEQSAGTVQRARHRVAAGRGRSRRRARRRARIALEVDDGPYAYRAVQEFAVEAGALDGADRGDEPGRGAGAVRDRAAPLVRARRRMSSCGSGRAHFYLEEPENLAGRPDRACRRSSTSRPGGRCRRGGGTTTMAAGTGGRRSRWPSRGVRLVMTADPVLRAPDGLCRPDEALLLRRAAEQRLGGVQPGSRIRRSGGRGPVLEPGESWRGRCGSRRGRPDRTRLDRFALGALLPGTYARLRAACALEAEQPERPPCNPFATPRLGLTAAASAARRPPAWRCR